MKRQTHEEFLNKMKSVNQNIEILSIYVSDKDKVECKCKICGYIWKDSATHLKQGRGCGNCKKLYKQKENARKFFSTSSIVHNNKYDYSKFKYIDSRTKGIIICPEHGEFLQIPNSHIKGHGCPLCAGNNYKRDTAEFIRRAQKVHGSNYDYSKAKYSTCKDKVLIICNKCHEEFWQTPDKHLQGQGCPNCKLQSQTKLYQRLKQSFHNEEIIFEAGSNIISWIENQRFDIYFPKYNIAVEYNGIQHYIPVLQFGGEIGFNDTQKRDQLKREKCSQNKCKLFEVKYDYTEDDYSRLVEEIQKYINNTYG